MASCTVWSVGKLGDTSLKGTAAILVVTQLLQKQLGRFSLLSLNRRSLGNKQDRQEPRDPPPPLTGAAAGYTGAGASLESSPTSVPAWR